MTSQDIIYVECFEKSEFYMKRPSKMIQSHLYTNQVETAFYPDREGKVAPLCLLSHGTWLGELERMDGWVHVIGIQGEGWVKAENVETRSPFNLHVQWIPGKPIEYVNAA